MKVTLDPTPGWGLVARRTNHMIKRLKLSVLPFDFEGGERGLRLNQWPLANNLVNHNYVMKPP